MNRFKQEISWNVSCKASFHLLPVPVSADILIHHKYPWRIYRLLTTKQDTLALLWPFSRSVHCFFFCFVCYTKPSGGIITQICYWCLSPSTWRMSWLSFCQYILSLVMNRAKMDLYNLIPGFYKFHFYMELVMLVWEC